MDIFYQAPSSKFQVPISAISSCDVYSGYYISDFSLNLDLSNAAIGEIDREITFGDIKLPSGIQVLNILPSKIFITVEKL